MNKETFVAIFYRNFKHHNHKHSHVGLGVSSLQLAKVLRQNGVMANVYGIWLVPDIRKVLEDNPQITHSIIQAPWASAVDLGALLFEFPHINFVVTCHSQIGFLQVEAGAVKLIRDYLMLEDESMNFHFAANSKRFQDFIQKTYNSPCLYLPNLYDPVRACQKRRHNPDQHKLRIGSFGAIRLLKNHATAAAAALELAKKRRVDLEFWLSTQREEHGKGVVDMIKNLFNGLIWAKVVESPWQNWAAFRHTVGHMDLNMQISATETFNLVSADSVAEGVPVVGSESIEWLPNSWIAEIDDIEDIVRVGNNLLNDFDAPEDGLQALQSYMQDSVKMWLQFLNK